MKKKNILVFSGIGLLLLVAAFFIIKLFTSKLDVNDAYKLIAVKFKEDGKISLINFDGEVVLDNEFSKDSKVFYSEGVVFEETEDDFIRYYKLDGKKTKQIADNNKLKGGLPFVNGHAVVRKESGMLALIDKSGEEVIENLSVVEQVKILRVGVVSDGLIRAKSSEGLWGYVNLEGKWKIKPAYQKCENFNSGKARAIKGDGTFVIIDKNGNEVLKGKEGTSYYPLSEGMICYYEESSEGKNSVGFMDLKGEKIIKDGKKFYKKGGIKFASYVFKGGVAVVSGEDSDSWGVIDKKGEIVGDLKLKFEEEPILSSDGKIFVNDPENKKCRIFSKKGEEINKIEDYKLVLPAINNKYIALKDRYKCMLIDEKGKDVGKLDDFFILNFEGFFEAVNNNEEFLNGLSLESKYYDYENIFNKILKTVSNNSICGVNENDNITKIIGVWPYESSGANQKKSTYVSSSDDYDRIMKSKKDEKSNESGLTNQSTESSAPSTFDTTTVSTSSITDKYPNIRLFDVNYTPSSRYEEGVSYGVNFAFSDYPKKVIMGIDPIYGYETPTGYELNNEAKLVRLDFGLVGSNEIPSTDFMKQLGKFLESKGWKASEENKYTNSANNNYILTGPSGISFYFPNNVPQSIDTAAPIESFE